MTDTVTITHAITIPSNATAKEIKKALSNISSNARISMMADTMKLTFEETFSKCEIEPCDYAEVVFEKPLPKYKIDELIR